MDSLESIKKEHEQIEVELKELEAVIEDDELNYSNLIHQLKKINSLWNSHESKEEKFINMHKDKYPELTFDKLILEHKEISGHNKVISNAINSGSEFEIKVSLDTDGKILMNKLRNHIKDEEKLFEKIQIKA